MSLKICVWRKHGKEGERGREGREEGREISPPRSFLKVGAYDLQDVSALEPAKQLVTSVTFVSFHMHENTRFDIWR